MRLGWGRDDGPFFFSCPGREPHERCEPGPILLCMGLFSRFCVWAPRCTAEEPLRCVRDTRSLVLRAHGESIQLQCIAASRGPFYFAWGCFRDFVSGLRGVPPK